MTTLSQLCMAKPLFPQTAAEIAASVEPTNLVREYGDIRRYGATAGADNTAAIQAACDAATAGDTVRLTVAGLINEEIHITTDDIVIDGCHRAQALTATHATSGGHDWSPYTQMFVADADRVFFRNMNCVGALDATTSRKYGGSYIWFAVGVEGGGVADSYFEAIGYVTGSNNVAVQVRNSANGVHVQTNRFKNCAGSVSHQGLHGSIHHNVAHVTDDAAAAPYTDTAGVFDQPFGTDGSTGVSVHNNRVYLSSGAPYSGALIGANTGASSFQIFANEIHGLRGGVALFIRDSDNGKVFDNIIDGRGYRSAAPWCFVRVDVDSSSVSIEGNILRGPLVAGSGGPGLGMDISTAGNRARGNRVLFGSSTNYLSCLDIAKGTTPAESIFEANYFQGGGVGTRLNLADNVLASSGFEQPIIHRYNVFTTPITVPYNNGSANRQIKFYLEDDRIASTAYNPSGTVVTTRLTRAFRFGRAADFHFRVGENADIHSAEAPAPGADYELTTWTRGDKVWFSDAAARTKGGSVCVQSGTFAQNSSPYSQGGTSTKGSPIVTALVSTALVLVGDYVACSAGFVTTGPFRVIAKTSTTLTLDTSADASASPTVTHSPPVFEPMASLAV
jgi:hypothetical protein